MLNMKVVLNYTYCTIFLCFELFRISQKKKQIFQTLVATFSNFEQLKTNFWELCQTTLLNVLAQSTQGYRGGRGVIKVLLFNLEGPLS